MAVQIMIAQVTKLGLLIITTLVILILIIFSITTRIKNKKVIGELLRDLGLTSFVAFIISGTITEIKIFWFFIPLSLIMVIAGIIIKEKYK